jgi:K+-sensing histidine kinase KdpD
MDPLEIDGQRELDAIVAHGLLNSLAVIAGAASTILQHGDAMGEDDLRVLTEAIDEQSAVFADGLQVLVRNASDTFADAATAVTLAAGVAHRVDAAGRALALDALVRRTGLVRQALDGLVRGLPPEVLELLNDALP